MIRNNIISTFINPGSRRYTRVFLLSLILVVASLNDATSQDVKKLDIDRVVELDPILTEISGISFIKKKIYAINDSGNRNDVHILRDNTFEVLSSERVSGSKNIDWEEISIYNNFLYIGDFGNNFGSRDDLAVYKISIDSLGKKKRKPEKISFEYKMQRSFKLTKYKRHPWDCEAMIVDEKGIWLFSKDWLDRTTRLYLLDDKEDSEKQQLTPLDSLNLDYLVTGAFYDEESERQFLCGYEGKHTFVTIFNNVSNPSLSGEYQRYRIDDLEYAQVESIFVKDNLMYLASERTGDKQSIYIITLPESGQ